jgi:hypothetical protein
MTYYLPLLEGISSFTFYKNRSYLGLVSKVGGRGG